MERLKKLLEDYKQNMNRQQELDTSLLSGQSKDEWVASLKARAQQMHSMYSENRAILTQLDDLLSIALTPETANQLYHEAHEMYWDDYDDCQILLPILYKLIEYYESNEDVDKLLFLYSAAFYEESEIQNRRVGTKETTVDYNLKIISYRDRYTQIKEVETRTRIWTAYYNYIVVGLGNKVINVETSYQYLLEALKLWNSPDVRELDENNETLNRIIKRIRSEWLASEEYIKDTSAEMQEYFCQLADSVFIEQLADAGDISGVDSEIYCAHLHSQVLQGQKTYDEITGLYLDYCQTKMQTCLSEESISDEDSYFLINAPLTLVRWIEYGISNDKKEIILDIVKKVTLENWLEKLNRYSTPFINEIMAEWCFKFLKHLDEQEEKEEWIFHLLVQRQLPTYLHSVMVSHLTAAFYKHIIIAKPELFHGLPEDATKDLPKFIRHCALLHDIGKTKITDIVNTQIRCLCEREFQGIRKHPEYGATMIDTDKDLSKYHDIVLGHHKFYDGTDGYPKNFDNTASDYRIIIDLITLCDCLDAASDHLGRNYKASKPLEEILEEFKAERGTRYNPDLVDILCSSASLQEEIRHIISDGRIDIMYDAYNHRY